MAKQPSEDRASYFPSSEQEQKSKCKAPERVFNQQLGFTVSRFALAAAAACENRYEPEPKTAKMKVCDSTFGHSQEKKIESCSQNVRTRRSFKVPWGIVTGPGSKLAAAGRCLAGVETPQGEGEGVQVAGMSGKKNPLWQQNNGQKSL